MGHDLDRRIGVLASRQRGVFTRMQALDVGLTDAQIGYRLSVHRWTALAAGLYAMNGATLTWESHVMGAVLSTGPNSTASHRTAVRLWGVLPGVAGPIEILVPLDAHHAARNGRVVRRAMYLGRRDVRRIGVIPVTAPARTLVDLASVVNDEQLETALDEFVAHGLITVAAVHRYVADRRLEHRRGAGRLRDLLTDRSQGVPQRNSSGDFCDSFGRISFRSRRGSVLPEIGRSTSRIPSS